MAQGTLGNAAAAPPGAGTKVASKDSQLSTNSGAHAVGR